MNRLLSVILLLMLLFAIYYFSKQLGRNGCSKETFIEGMTSGGDVTIKDFFAPKTLNKNCTSSSTHSKVPNSEEKTIPEASSPPYKLQYEYKIKDQGWGNNTYGYLILKNLTKNTEHRLKSSKGRNTVTAKGTADITDYVNAGDKVQLKFKESRCWSGHTLYWYYYKDMNLTHGPCKNKPDPKPTAENSFYYVCEKKTFMEHHQDAIAMGAQLASIHSAAENEAVKQLLPAAGRVFIGAIRKRPGSGDGADKWGWTDGSAWDYANWRSGEPNDCCKAQTGNIGEVYGEIQKSDGKWNDIMHKYNNDVKKFGAVYKLNATYPSVNLKKLNTDGSNSWLKSVETCEGPQNSGTIQGSFGTLPSRREVLDYLKGVPLGEDKFVPVSDANNDWLQVGNRKSRAGLSPDYGLLHQDMPDVAYTKSGNEAKPSWGLTSNAEAVRNVIFCKVPPDGQTWDKQGKKFVTATPPPPGQVTATTASNLVSGSNTITLPSNAQSMGFQIGQTIVIGTPPNTEEKTIVGFS